LRRISEEITRKEMIDPQLEHAGWYLHDHSKVKTEIPVDGYDAEPWNGVSDYYLYRENGEVLAVVEAKRTSTDVRLAEAQLTYYVTEIEKHQSFRPFGFLANGLEIHFVDVGIAHKREVFGFFTREDLENLLYIRQNAKPLSSIEINNTIVDRSYQHEAIRRVGEAFANGKRNALIVMATGTGKTRTTMGLIDVFMRSNQARRILFVADRDPLVNQAREDGFEKYLPGEPCTRIHSWDDPNTRTQRLFAVTLQTLSNIFEQFSPAYFDLIIFDEVHRSIFNRWSEVLKYFDGHMIGLTATPASYIDRDTFNAFDCFDDKPTYLYTYEQAVKDDYLVDYTLYAARTRFQQEGIKGANLTEEERNLLIQHGLDPDDINYEGTELEEKVTVTDMLRRQWQEIMEVCLKDPSGRPCKTIVFAMTKKHALRLADAFYDVFPQYVDMAKVVISEGDYRSKNFKAFKKENLPRIAISVDMLDTGVDVPEVMNLVFMKPVQSPIKLQQMLGRGTRVQAACHFLDRLPENGKKEFLVIDFWDNNFSHGAKEAVDTSLPVLVRIFNTRLNLLETYLDDQKNPECQRVVADLRKMVQRIPKDSLLVRHDLPKIEDIWEDSFWNYLLPANIEKLRKFAAPHLRYAADVDVAAETFTSKIERMKLSRRRGQPTAELALSIAEDANKLPENILTKKQVELCRQCTVPELENASFEKLNEIRDALAEEMKKKKKDNDILELDYLHDFIAVRGFIMLTKSGEQMYVAEYRRLVEQRILELVANHPTIKAIVGAEHRSALAIDDWQLLELERTLTKELGEGDLEVTPENLKKVFAHTADSFLSLVRQVLDMQYLPDYKDLVARQFETYVTQHNYNADQIRFLRAVQSVFLQKRHLEPADLYEPPLDMFGADAVERWFTEKEVEEVVIFANRMSVYLSL
jgi:type I restriction enzyme R subunit